MLLLQIGFPTGRYCGASVDDPRMPEWPPHPSRVFSALVAAAYAGGRQPSDIERSALEDLEAAPPPALAFPDADVQPAPDVYVPVNDPKARLDASRLKSRGVLAPNRQVRQFPAAVILGEPQVELHWSLEVSEEVLNTLNAIAGRVTHVGTSHSLATARFSRSPDAPVRWTPHPAGSHFVRVPRRGRLSELDQIAAGRTGSLRRPSPLCEVLWPYAPVVTSTETPLPSLHDWVTLRLQDAAWGADTSHSLARALRRAALSVLGDDAPASVHGHDLSVQHLAWLPLAEVGHSQARGRIRGLAIGLPWTMPEAERLRTLVAMTKLQRLTLPGGQVATLTPSIEGMDTPLTLRKATWCGPATWWSTVTPVVLDRPPKHPDQDAIAAAVAESLINAGHPAPEAVWVLGSSDFDGAPTAQQVPTRLPRFHARVRFATAITGPVIAGRWKNFGVGLFRPLPNGPTA